MNCLLLILAVTMTSETLSRRLQARGDQLSIQNGRLEIKAASGAEIPSDWLSLHQDILVSELVQKAGVLALLYEGCSTGNYGAHRAGGVTLQFSKVQTEAFFHVIFNADLTRARSSKSGKAGSPLPSGHFRVGRRSHFYKFWVSSGLKIPNRLPSFYDYMGNLRGIIFTGEIQKNRLNADSLKPLNLTYEQISTAIQPDHSQTNTGQIPDNIRTSIPDKDCALAQTNQYFQDKSTTCQFNHGISDQGSASIRGNVYPLHAGKTIEEQTNVEWLADYGID
jgi:hypothetical protein